MLLVCLGNICRSPMAHVVLEDKLERAGLTGRVSVTSRGTGDWHLGEPMDRRAATTLVGAGYDPTAHRSQQVDAAELGSADLVLAMDEANRRDLAAIEVPGEGEAAGDLGDRLRLFREFDPAGDAAADLPDPFYGGDDGFTQVLAILERTTITLVDRLGRTLVPEDG